MTARERLFAALDGSPTDRAPVWLLFPYHPIGCYVDVRTHPKYRRVFDASKKYAIMLNRRGLNAPLHAPDVTRGHSEEVVDGVQVKRETLEHASRVLTKESAPGRIKHMLNSSEDLEAFCDFPVETDPARIESALDGQLQQYMQEKQEFPEEYGAMMLPLNEPIGALYGISNLEEYAIWSLTHSDGVDGFLDRVMEHKRMVYRYCLERELADVYFLVGSELASPPLVNRATFQRWVVPYARGLIELIHSYGKRVIQHYHGQIKEIMPDFVTMGPDGLHTIEAPPVGDCTFAEAFDVVGSGMTLIGNVQYDDFRALSADQMARAVRDVLDECRGQRLILSPTAGPYDPDPPDALIENYVAFMTAAWEYPWP